MKKRIAWLDSIKGFMIIFVIMCHSLVVNRNVGLPGHWDAIAMYIITIFIMPCFFAVSGFLYNRVRSLHQYWILWYKKGMGLIIPYFVFSIILHYYMHDKRALSSIFYQPIFLMWFLFALFFIFIIVGTLDLFRVPVWTQCVIYAVVMVAQTRLPWWNGPDFDMNPVACTLGYLFFFYLGFLLKDYLNAVKRLLNHVPVVIALFLIFMIGTFVQAKYTGVFPYNPDAVALSDLGTKFVSVLAFFSLFMTFDLHLNWLDLIGRNTLVVYLVHYFAVHEAFMWTLRDTMIKSPLIQSGIRFVAGILFSLLMIWVVKRVKLIKYVFYPRRYFDKFIL